MMIDGNSEMSELATEQYVEGLVKKSSDEAENAIQLSDERSRFRLESLKIETFEKLDQLNGRLLPIEEAMQRVEARLSRPWYRDRKFWAGAIALPCLVVSGMLVEKLANEPALLNLIHRGMGTDVAVIETVSGNKVLNPTVEESIAKKISPNDTNLASAVRTLAQSTIFEGNEFEERVSNAVRLREPILHIDVLSLGIRDPILLLNSDPSLPQKNGRVEEVSTTFTAQPGQAARLKVGVFVTEVDMDSFEELLYEVDYKKRLEINNRLYRKKTIDGSLSDVISIDIDGSDVQFEDQSVVFPRVIDGEAWELTGYVSEKFKFSDKIGGSDFPVKVITIETNRNIDWDFTARVVVIVERADEV